MFGLAVFILLAITGIAIDSSRINRLNMRTTTALDAAALATAKTLRLADASNAELNAIAEAYFDSNLRAQNQFEGRTENFAVTIDREQSRIAISVDIVLPTTIGRVFNVNEHRNTLSAQAIYSARDIELGMMLDVSGSMAGAKVQELRDAAKDLVEIVLNESQGPTKNRIGIAPYSSAVNAGVYAQLATKNPNPPTSTHVTERPGAHAFKDTSPFTGPLGKKTNKCTDSTVVPLTADRSVLDDHIDQLSAGGSTAGHLGIAWSWYIVSPEWAGFWPAESTPRAYDDPEAMKAVIIMTDGEFNTAFEPGNGNSSQQSDKLCANMKNAGVTVFSVGFEAPASALDVLRQCATKSSYFFEARNGNELRDAFRRIANELTGLRLTH